MPDIKNIKITAEMLAQIAELDEFKGAWGGFTDMRPDELKALKNYKEEPENSCRFRLLAKTWYD